MQEIPLYEASGEGEHVYCEVEKVGISTFEAVDRLARGLNVDPRGIGYAGMKDAAAITRQIFSILGTTEAAVMGANIAGMRVLWASRHGNKLRLGHLKANRFAIKIRDVNPTDVVRLAPLVRRLTEVGMPNYFGQQRFGRRGDNHLLGAALIRGDDLGVLKLLLGTPKPELDDPKQRLARESFDKGEYEIAMKHWPRSSGMERRILARFIKTERPAAAVARWKSGFGGCGSRRCNRNYSIKSCRSALKPWGNCLTEIWRRSMRTGRFSESRARRRSSHAPMRLRSARRGRWWDIG